jgi:hypothetical protein
MRRTRKLHLRRGKVRLRRNLVVAAHSGEGPLTIRLTDLRHRALQNRCLLRSRPDKALEGKLDGGAGKHGGGFLCE